MTIRLLAKYDKYDANTIVTLDAATEAGLIAQRQATTNLAGGVPYVAPVLPNQRYSISLETDPSGTPIALVGGPGDRRVAVGSGGAAKSIMFLGSSSMARGSVMPHLPENDPVRGISVNTSTLNARGLFVIRTFVAAGTTVATGAKLDYNKAANTLTWTASGDTPGTPVQIVPEKLFYVLQSGTPGMELYAEVVSRFAPVADASATFFTPGATAQHYTNVSSYGIPGIAQTLLGASLAESVSYAVVGTTLEDWRKAMPQWSGVLTDITVIYAGTNDILSRDDVGPALANMEAIVRARIDVASRVAVGTPFPGNGRTQAQTEAIAEFSMGLRRMADRLGFDLWDAWPWVAQADGSWIPAYTVDGTHASGLGAQIIAKRALVPVLKTMVAQSFPVAFAGVAYNATTAPYGNLLPNIGMTGTGGGKGAGVTGTTPNNYTAARDVGATLTAVCKAPDDAAATPLPDGRAGKYFTATISNANASAVDGEGFRIFLQAAISSGFTAGEYIEFEGEFTLSGVGIRTLDVRASTTGSAVRSYAISFDEAASAAALSNLDGETVTYKFRTKALKIPAGVTGLNIAIGLTLNIGGNAALNVCPTLNLHKVPAP